MPDGGREEGTEREREGDKNLRKKERAPRVLRRRKPLSSGVSC